MIAMEEFSTENEIPSVSYEKGLSLGKTAVAKNLIWKIGIEFFHLWWRLLFWALLFIKNIHAPRRLN